MQQSEQVTFLSAECCKFGKSVLNMLFSPQYEMLIDDIYKPKQRKKVIGQ